MKVHRSVFAGFIIATGFSAVAQEPGAGVRLADLRTPPSPAFVLLGVAPTVIERPATPRALGLALLSAADDSGSATPKDFALEVAPYWLVERPGLTFQRTDAPSFWQSLQQTFSISAATRQVLQATDGQSAGATNLVTLGGVGVRASWPIGPRSKLEQQVLDAYVRRAADVAVSLGEPEPGKTPPEARLRSINDALKPYAMSLRDAMKQGRWIIEAAAASSASFQDNNINHSSAQRTAFWLTPSYRFVRSTFDPATGSLSSTPNVDVVGVVRQFRDRTAATDRNPLDIGARIVWDTGTIALSAEHLQRLRVTKKTSRTAAVAELKVSDNLYLSATLGRAFDDEPATKGNLLAILGLNFNLGKIPRLIGPAIP